MVTEYRFKSQEIESQIPNLVSKNITEFSIHDEALAKDKRRVLKILGLLEQHAPFVFVSFLIDASILDREVINAASKIYISFDIPLRCTSKGGKILFDKKFYANKARLLNESGIVFGFMLFYAVDECDTLKAFMERLDFAVQQYPNHIDFPQLENTEREDFEAKVTGLFSAKDIRYSREVSFACKTFYSFGRAVPWFLSVLKPLRLYPSKFFADFAEWQRCNNCDFKSGYTPEKENHLDIEKMQILFTNEKYEEKSKNEYIVLVDDIIRVNGAMSRVVAENMETVMETSYNPDDLFSPEVLDLESFMENVCMEHCKIKIFAGGEGPDFIVQ